MDLKIIALGLERWFDEKNIIISEEYGSENEEAESSIQKEIAEAQKFEKELDVLQKKMAQNVQDLQEEGVRVNVTSFSANLSYSLKDKADEVRILDDIPLVKMQQKSIEEGC